MRASIKARPKFCRVGSKGRLRPVGRGLFFMKSSGYFRPQPKHAFCRIRFGGARISKHQAVIMQHCLWPNARKR